MGDATFKGNTAGEEGGALYLESDNNDGSTGDQSIIFNGDATFENNSAGYQGGAIYLENNSDGGDSGDQEIVFMGDATFKGNTAGEEGGALYLESDNEDGSTGDQSIVFNGDATFENNSAGNEGGAIFLENNSDGGDSGDQEIVFMGDATFKGNTAGDEGGALYLESDNEDGSTGDQSIIFNGDATFENNSAGNAGGAINLQSNSNTGGSTGDQEIVFMGDATFKGNTAGSQGGAIYLESYSGNGDIGDQSIVFSGVAIFENNSAGSQGGAIYLESYSYDGSTGDQSIVFMGDATFKGNTAGEEGGALYLESYSYEDGSTGDQSIVFNGDATFENNSAGYQGGAINLESNSNTGGSTGDQEIVFMGDATFKGNTAGEEGGALYLESDNDYGSTGYQSIIFNGDATFENNSAGSSGGAIHLGISSNSGSTGDQTIIIDGNATFKYNTADGNGGAISMKSTGTDGNSQGLVLAESSQFIGNYAGASGGAISMQSTGATGANGESGEVRDYEGDGGSGYIGGHGADQQIVLNNGEFIFRDNQSVEFGGAIFMKSQGGNGGNGGNGVNYWNYDPIGTIGGDGGIGGRGGMQIISGSGMGSTSDLLFESNQSGIGGGGIFMSNIAGEGGSNGFGSMLNGDDGISGGAGSQVVFSASLTFDGNGSGGGSGGGINMYNTGATGGYQYVGSIGAASFNDNVAGASGGAISMTNFGTVTNAGTQFTFFGGDVELSNNRAQGGRGGAIRMYNTGVENGGLQSIMVGGISAQSDAIFIGNYASNDGGAISMYNVGEFGNSGNQAIYVSGGTQFSENSSGGNGGAVRMENRSFEEDAGSQYLSIIGDATFIDNHAINGGAIYMYSLGVAEVVGQVISIAGDASFLSNTADQLGAAIYMRNTVVGDFVFDENGQYVYEFGVKVRSQAGSQEISFGSDITFVNNGDSDGDNNGNSVGAITMLTNKSETDPLQLTLAFIANVTDTSSSLHFISNHTGDFYYLILDANELAPTAEEVIANGAAATGPVTSGQLVSGLLDELSINGQYKVYVVVQVADSLSPVTALEFTASDTTDPTLSPISSTDIGGTTGTFTFISSEAGDYYYLVLPGSSQAPSVESIIKGKKGEAKVGLNPIEVDELTSETSYKIYLVVKDSAGNISRVSTGSFTTLDITLPAVSPIDIQYDGTSATFVFASDEAGRYYYIIRYSDEEAPNVSEILSEGNSANAVAGDNTILMPDLESQRSYTIYVVVEDESENVSELLSQSFTTLDVTDPEISSLSTSSLGTTSATINFTASEDGSYYYLLLLATDPDPDEGTLFDATRESVNSGPNSISLAGLTPGQTYRIHLLLLDGINNPSSISRLTFTTPVLENNPGGGGSSGNEFSDLIFEKRNRYYAAKVTDNVSKIRASIRTISEPDTFVMANLKTLTFDLANPVYLEFIKQLTIIYGTGGIEKFMDLISESQKIKNTADFDTAFERIYGISINDWYEKIAAPALISSLETQDSNTLLEDLIDYEVLRAFAASTGSAANPLLMDSTMQRILRDILAIDGGLSKLEELVKAVGNNPSELARQRAFERIYGISFNQWVEDKAIVWMKEALGIPYLLASKNQLDGGAR
jgi:predicted outer membrane repeat protein